MKFRDYSNYEIYEDGKIWSYKTKRFLKPGTNNLGYQVVNLYDNEGKRKMYLVHRVVFETFSGSQIPKGYEINHIDEMKDNNARSNLELVSHKDNCNYGTRNKRILNSRSKQVGAFKDDELVFVFKSTMEARRNGFNQGAVSACCRNSYSREGNNIYKGFIWRYL